MSTSSPDSSPGTGLAHPTIHRNEWWMTLKGTTMTAGALLAGCGSGTSPAATQTGAGASDDSLTAIVACYRAHGDPSFPDPDPNGSFGLPPSLMTKTPAWVQASQACARLIPSGGLNVHAGT
jgi:hypothetical protein